MSASLETLVPSDSVLDGVLTQIKMISESFMVWATSVVKVMFLFTRKAFYDSMLEIWESYLKVLLEAGLVEGKLLGIPFFYECFADIANNNIDIGVDGSEDD
jgi:spore maturation protein SpmA